MIKGFSIVFTICLFLTSTSLFADSNAQSSEAIDKMIANNKLAQALPVIEAGLKKSPNDLGLLMRKSRIITLQGDQNSDEDGKVKSYENAQKIADTMIELNPKSAKGYLRRAIAKGKLILYKGILQSRSLILEVRADTKVVLGLESASSYEKALANYVLGRAHLKLAAKPKALRLPLGLAWASKSKGGEFLKKAQELSPNSIPFNLDYAMWLKDNGDKAQAKKLLENIATLEIYDPADPGHKQKAKALLSDWK